MSKMIENYILKEQIGQGQYGKVYRALDTKTQMYVAIKAIKLNKFHEIPKLNEFTNNEIQILSRIENQNVIKFIEILQTSNNVYLVYEYCNGGTLEDLIKKQKYLQENQALKIFNQILNAFQSLIKANILHRDLKPSNILLHDGIIKVADFGFCKSLLNSQDLSKTMVGSPIYMAPEILQGKNYSIKADVWSMGVVLFEMLFGYCPYEDKTIASLINQINYKTLKFPTNIQKISQLADTLLRCMLVIEPKSRIEWNQLLKIQTVIEKQLSNSMNTVQIQKENYQPYQQFSQQQIRQQLASHQALQPIINQQLAKTTQNSYSQSQEAPKSLIKQYSQANLNYKLNVNSNQSQYKSQNNDNEKSKNTQRTSNEANKIDISQIFKKNMNIILEQRKKISQAINLLKELLSIQLNFNDHLVLLIFMTFHIIYWEIKKLSQQICLENSQSEIQLQQKFFDCKQFKTFEQIFQSEKEEIEKCLEIYQNEIKQFIDFSNQKSILNKFMEFNFNNHEFVNKISIQEVLDQLIFIIMSNQNDQNMTFSQKKQFIICINNLINYLGGTNDFIKETIDQVKQSQFLEEPIQRILSNIQTLKRSINFEEIV